MTIFETKAIVGELLSGLQARRESFNSRDDSGSERMSPKGQMSFSTLAGDMARGLGSWWHTFSFDAKCEN